MIMFNLLAVNWAAVAEAFVPIKSFDYCRRTFVTIERIHSGDPHRRAQINSLFLLLSLTTIHWSVLAVLPPQDYLHQLIYFDMFALTGVPRFFAEIFVGAQLLAIYVYYVVYFKIYNNRMTKEIELVLNNPRKSIVWPNYDQFYRRSLVNLNANLNCAVVSVYVWLGVIVVLAWNLHRETQNFELSTRVQYFFIFGCLIGLNAINIVLLATIFSFCVFYATSAFELMFSLIDVTASLISSVKVGLHSLFRVNLFLRRYCRSVELMFAFNKFFSTLFLYFSVINIPLNLASINIFLFHPLPFFSKFLLFAIAMAQIQVIFLLHWMCSHLSQKLHRPIKKLISINLAFASLHPSKRYRLAKTIEAFHTRKHYGLSYHNIRLITIDTFTKFIFFYIKFMLITHKILNK